MAAVKGAGNVTATWNSNDITATSASIKLQSATTSGGSFSDEMTVTFSGVGAFLAANVGTTNKFLKYNCTSLGGATSFVVTIYSIVTGVTG